MYCNQCGAKLEDGAKFCSNCGTKINPIAEEKTEASSKREEKYDGTVHKCPNCGGIIEAFQTKCLNCGYEFRDVGGSSSVKDLQRKIEQIEAERPRRTAAGEFLKSLTTSVEATDSKIATTIKNFAIPSTKEDILEFMIIAASNIDPDGYDRTSKAGSDAEGLRLVNDAWDSKYNQAYQKAILSFPDEPRLQEIKELYNSKMKQAKKAKGKRTKLLIGCVVLYVLLMLFIFLIK